MTQQPMPIPQVNKKVCLLGDFAVGKTSLVRRFVYNLFDEKYISTIGVKVSRKAITVSNEGKVIELVMMLWDLAGSEEFDRVRTSYLRGASAAILVCDLTRPESLDNLSLYVKELRAVRPAAELVLAANKSDLIEQWQASQLPLLDVEAVGREASRLGAKCFFTSAKTGAGVDEMFRELGQLLVAGEV